MTPPPVLVRFAKQSSTWDPRVRLPVLNMARINLSRANVFFDHHALMSRTSTTPLSKRQTIKGPLRIASMPIGKVSEGETTLATGLCAAKRKVGCRSRIKYRLEMIKQQRRRRTAPFGDDETDSLLSPCPACSGIGKDDDMTRCGKPRKRQKEIMRCERKGRFRG